MKFKKYQIIVTIDSPDKDKLVKDLITKACLNNSGELIAKAMGIYEAYLDGVLVEKEKQ